MNRTKIFNILSLILICFSAMGILSVSVMAFMDPQAVMDLVQVKLTNPDAYSSIRGVYGGAGLTIFITLVYLAVKNRSQGLVFAGLLWGLYALSRLITIAVEGNLGAFGNQWLVIESILCISAVALLFLRSTHRTAAV